MSLSYSETANELEQANATIGRLRAALAAAEKEAAEELKWLRGQVFALCEDTEAECASSRLIDGQAGDYARGRVKEAKSIRNAIGVVVEERLRMEKTSIDDAEKRARIRKLVNRQAEDDGLWFVAQYASEAYLQQELRRLHAAIEEWL